MNGTVEVVESVAGAFAALVAEQVGRQRAGGFSLFLSGGPTAQKAYERLAVSGGPAGDRTIDWGTVDAYWGDERCVPVDDVDSNYRMGHQALLDVVGPLRSDHPMYRSGAPADAAAAYQNELAALGSFDLVHLGLGDDGHCASLFPGSGALAVDDDGLLVVANRDPNANNPHDRITLTFPGIARARLVVFTVSGASKRQALTRLVAGEDLPAGRVTADKVIWLVETDAATGTGLG